MCDCFRLTCNSAVHAAELQIRPCAETCQRGAVLVMQTASTYGMMLNYNGVIGVLGWDGLLACLILHTVFSMLLTIV